MADIQVYQETSIFDTKVRSNLDQAIDARLISERRSGGGKVKYVQGHSAIDQANRIFGYGNWGWRVVSVEQIVLEDPLNHEAVGIEYRAVVEVTVRGAVPISDVGSQPVSTWNVDDQIMQRRLKANRGNDTSDFTPIEKREARAVIVDAHEAAKKGAVTDALKRALRGYGNQFGNSLYGDGHVNIGDNAVDSVDPMVTKYTALANEHVSGGWTAVRAQIIETAHITGDISDGQILTDFLKEVQGIIRAAANAPRARVTVEANA